MPWAHCELEFTVVHDPDRELGDALARVESTLTSIGARNVTIINEGAACRVYYEYEHDPDDPAGTVEAAGPLMLKTAFLLAGVDPGPP